MVNEPVEDGWRQKFLGIHKDVYHYHLRRHLWVMHGIEIRKGTKGRRQEELRIHKSIHAEGATHGVHEL